MLRVLRTISIVAAGLLLGACASHLSYSEMQALMPPQPADKGRIYLYRESAFIGNLITPDIVVNGKMVGVSNPGTFFYIDRDWREQSRPAMAMQWIKHLVLNVFDASPYIPVKMAIVLADPPNCRPAQAIDWRPVWQRARQAHAANTARPVAGTNTGG